MASIYQGRTKTTRASSIFAAKRAREAVKGISTKDLKKDDCVEEIIRILDDIFQNDETTRPYYAFKDYV